MNDELTIQQLAERTGLTAHTLRYYERIGLLANIPRNASGYRAYTAAHLANAHAIKHLRATGMTISQIQEFVRSYRQGEAALEECCELLVEHRARLYDQMDALQQEIGALERKLHAFRQRSQAALALEHEPR